MPKSRMVRASLIMVMFIGRLNFNTFNKVEGYLGSGEFVTIWLRNGLLDTRDSGK